MDALDADQLSPKFLTFLSSKIIKHNLYYYNMPLKTPICDFGQAAKSFELKSTNNEIIKLNDVKGTNGNFGYVYL